jgi:hypothetical protein
MTDISENIVIFFKPEIQYSGTKDRKYIELTERIGEDSEIPFQSIHKDSVTAVFEPDGSEMFRGSYLVKAAPLAIRGMPAGVQMQFNRGLSYEGIRDDGYLVFNRKAAYAGPIVLPVEKVSGVYTLDKMPLWENPSLNK